MRILDIGKRWRLPDAIWKRMRRLIPQHHPSPLGGRPPLEARRVADGIYYVMRTGCPWKAAPPQFGSGSSLHHYFQVWTRHRVFRRLWKQGLIEYDRRKRIRWRWLTLDATMTKAPLGGEKDREKPHGSRQAGDEAIGPHGRARRSAGRRRGASEFA
jgi:transposase